MNIYKITTIVLFLLLIASGIYIYSIISETSNKTAVDNTETTKVNNDMSLTNSGLASSESASFRSCAMEKFKDNLEVITLKEDLKQDNDPIEFGGCNGNWLRPICEFSIAQMTNDKDDSFKKALNDCMIKELY